MIKIINFALVNHKKNIAFHTLGCKLNFSESSSIANELIQKGYSIVDFKEQADIYIIHSCSVTNNADKKTVSAVRQAHRKNPEAHIALLGCYAQLKPEQAAQIDGVDVVLGNTEKFDLFNYLNELNGENKKIVHSDEFKNNLTFVPTYSSEDRTRSFFKIQDGCDNFCAYCTVPLARGRSRSNSINQTIEVFKKIAETKIKEVVLTGVNIGDFGKKNKENLLDLLKELNKIKGIERLRISSIEPDLLPDEMIEYISQSKKILPHFHLPLQSGSNKILQKMGRHYTKEFFSDKVKQIKTVMPESCIAVDVIVGFPGETDDDFLETYQCLERVDISYLHVFTYSEREKTKAIQLADSVPIQIRNQRSEQLHKLSDKKKEIFYKKNIGRKVNVLFESDNIKGFISGFSENYIRVKTKFNKVLINQIVQIELSDIDTDGVFIAKL